MVGWVGVAQSFAQLANEWARVASFKNLLRQERGASG